MGRIVDKSYPHVENFVDKLLPIFHAHRVNGQIKSVMWKTMWKECGKPVSYPQLGEVIRTTKAELLKVIHIDGENFSI